MYESFVDTNYILKIEPRLKDYLETGKINFQEFIDKSNETLIYDLKNSVT